jgi:hypothetical protein
MSHIGVGIGVNKSPIKTAIDKQNHTLRKVDSTTCDDYDDEDHQNVIAHSVLNTQNSSNSSDQRRIGGGDDDNSNSFESHSDFDLNNPTEKKLRVPNNNNKNEKSSRQKDRRGMSVNWGSSATSPINVSSTIANTNRFIRPNHKHSSNMKDFATSMAHSLYKNPIRLSGFTSASKPKGSNSIPNKIGPDITSNQLYTPNRLTSIPSEAELSLCRIYPPPQPRPESLAIMSEELFHEKLKARQSPFVTATPHNLSPPSQQPIATTTTLLTVDNRLSTELPSTSSLLFDDHCIEDVTYSITNQCISTNSDQTLKNQSSPSLSTPIVEQQQYSTDTIDISDEILTEEEQEQKLSSPINAIINKNDYSSDDSWRLLNSNSSLDDPIPYIDETDFEDLGKKFKL